MYNFSLLSRRHIDTSAWDDTVRDSTAATLPYAYTGYLDALTQRHWHGLVLHPANNPTTYAAVMPLPYNCKLFGIPQIYQPLHCQQLGLFASPELWETQAPLLNSILNHIPRRYWRVGTTLNETNTTLANNAGRFVVTPRVNYVLPLERSYAEIQAGYRSGLKDSLRSAQKHSLRFVSGIGIAAWQRIFERFTAARFTHEGKNTLPRTFISDALRIATYNEAAGLGETVGVYSSSGEMLAAAFLLRTEARDVRRITYLFSATTEAGRKAKAIPFLLNTIIETHAQTPTLLDFEGSSVAGIAAFYAGFGAEVRTYYSLHL